jgi:hypothetical protein
MFSITAPPPVSTIPDASAAWQPARVISVLRHRQHLLDARLDHVGERAPREVMRRAARRAPATSIDWSSGVIVASALP